jgi:hypothetical protein
MKPEAYAILRVTPLKSWSQVSAMSRHGRRIGSDMDHIDRDRSSMNRAGSDWPCDAGDLRTCMQTVMEHHGAKLRKGAPVGSHVLLSASAAYFRPHDPGAMGTWDPERVETWLSANLAWANRRWPSQIAAWRLDLDEATPHLDLFLVPIHHWKTRGGKTVCQVSHRNAFAASRRSFTMLQDEYAKQMEPLGLKRGRPRSVTRAVHVHPAVLRRQMAQEAAHQQAVKVGTGALLRRDVRMLRLDEKGSPAADFSASVPVGARRRLLEICRPAWRLLMRLERELMFQAKRFVADSMRELLAEASIDRQEASRTLDDAREIFDIIRDRDRMLRGRTWEDVVLELIR